MGGPSGLSLGSLALIVALVVAGCVGSPPPPGVAASHAAPATVAHSSGDGAIRGVVVDEEERPIEQASVGGVNRAAANVTFEASTDALGQFLVTGLLPGDYVLQVGRLGYHTPAPRVVEVPAGDEVEVRFTLAAMPVLEPFHETKIYTIYWEEEIGLLLPDPVGYFGIITGWNSQNVTMPIEVNEEEQGELGAIVVEMAWQPPLGYCKGAFRSDVFSPEQTGLDPTFPPLNSRFWGDENPYHWDNVPERARTPTHLFIPRSGDNVSAMHSAARTELNGGEPILTEGKWIVELNSAAEYAPGAFGTPVDVACTFDTTVNVYVSTFFLHTPEPTWSFLAAP